MAHPRDGEEAGEAATTATTATGQPSGGPVAPGDLERGAADAESCSSFFYQDFRPVCFFPFFLTRKKTCKNPRPLRLSINIYKNWILPKRE